MKFYFTGANDSEFVKNCEQILEESRSQVLKILEKIPEGLMPEVEVELSTRLKTCGGRAIGSKKIQLHYRLLKQNMHNLKEVLIHELAHIIQHLVAPRSQSHGWQWRAIMGRLGQEANRTHKMDVNEFRPKRRKGYAYKCGCPMFYHNVTEAKHKKLQERVATHGKTFCYCSDCKMPLSHAENTSFGLIG